MEMEIGNGNGNAPIAGARLLAALLVPTPDEAGKLEAGRAPQWRSQAGAHWGTCPSN